MSLPELIVFSVSDSNNEVRYLSFTGPQRQLRFGPDEGVFSDLARFAIESAGDGGLVHIRSCYENCYWARASRFEPWLVASAREKEEDMWKDECTLFRPRLSAGNVFVEFVHAQSGKNVVMLPATDAHAYSLCVEHGAPTEFRVTDFAALTRTKLPRYVAFLGDNNKYLSAIRVALTGYNHFAQYDAPTNREVGYEVLYDKSGTNLRVKSMSMDEFWCVLPRDPTVYMNSLPEFDPATLFDVAVSSPPNTIEQGIALRSLVNDRYCQRDQRIHHELSAGSTSPNNRLAWIRPMPLGVFRVNIESFRHAWRGPKSSLVLSVMNIFNNSNDAAETVENVQYSKRTTNTYSNSMSLVKGSAVFTGRIPNIGSTGELEFPNAATQVSAIWGSSTSISSTVKEDVLLKLPAMSLVTATLSVNKLTYEVPFSYQQVNVFQFGGSETENFDDGVYRIESDYGASFSYDIQPLTSEAVLDQNIYTDVQVLKQKGINAIEDGIEANAASDKVNQE